MPPRLKALMAIRGDQDLSFARSTGDDHIPTSESMAAPLIATKIALAPRSDLHRPGTNIADLCKENAWASTYRSQQQSSMGARESERGAAPLRPATDVLHLHALARSDSTRCWQREWATDLPARQVRLPAGARLA